MRSMSCGPGALSSVLVIVVLIVSGCNVNFGEWPEDAGGDADADTDADPCEGVSCGDHGECHVLDGEPICGCETGYDGEECDRCYPGYHHEDGDCMFDHECLPTSCAGHGECDDEGGDVTCECDSGFDPATNCATCLEGYHRSGESCVEDETCDDHGCSGHGTCDASTGVAICTCDDGYRGDECDECYPGYHDQDDGTCVKDDRCLDTSCAGHGSCDDDGGEVICTCFEGYAPPACVECTDDYHHEGSSCEPNESCSPDPCSGHGACDDSTGVAICTCHDGYRGVTCEACYPGYHDDSDGTCARDEGCLETSCAGHGACDDSTGLVICDCDDEYIGDSCAECAAGYHHEGLECAPDDTCEDRGCSGNGDCELDGGVARCVCEDGYRGDDCDECYPGYEDHGGVCVIPICGDGFVDPDEECDLGEANALNGPCLPTCVTASCGDGHVCFEEGCEEVLEHGVEYCDDGPAGSCADDCLDGERIIDTVAGGGVCDGLPARAAVWYGSLAVNPYDHTIYGADSLHHRVRRIDPTPGVIATGVITTFAGTGERGFADGARVNALFDTPMDLDVTDDGIWLVVMDTGNAVLREMGTDFGGVTDVHVIAGEPWNRDIYSGGLGGDLGGGELAVSGDWIYYRSGYQVRRANRVSGATEHVVAGWGRGCEDGVADVARFSGIGGLEWINGELWIGDTECGALRVFSEGYLRTSWSLHSIRGLAELHWNAVLIAGGEQHQCMALTISSSSRGVIAGTGDPATWDPADPTADGDGGPALAARLGNVIDIDYASPNAIIRESGPRGERLRSFHVEGVNIDTIAGNGFTDYCGDVGTADEYEHPEGGEWDYSATNAALNQPYRVVLLEDGTLVWTEAGNHVVRMRLPDGTIDTLAGDGTAGYEDPDGAPRFNYPLGIADDRAGGVVVTEYVGNRLRRIDMASREVTTLAGTGVEGSAVDGTPAIAAPLCNPTDVAIADDGTMYVVDRCNNRIFRIVDGVIENYAGTRGVLGDTGDEGWATAATLNGPMGIDLAEDGTLYIAQFAGATGHRIRRVDTDSPPRIHAFAGNPTSLDYDEDERDPLLAGMCAPSDVIVSRDSVYIVDSSHNVVRIVRNEGGIQTIRTVAGNGASDFGGDSGLASNASLNGPLGVAVDAHGGLYIADSDNNRIRHAYFPEAH